MGALCFSMSKFYYFISWKCIVEPEICIGWIYFFILNIVVVAHMVMWVRIVTYRPCDTPVTPFNLLSDGPILLWMVPGCSKRNPGWPPQWLRRDPHDPWIFVGSSLSVPCLSSSVRFILLWKQFLNSFRSSTIVNSYPN